MLKEVNFDSHFNKKASKNRCKKAKERVKYSTFNLLIFLLKYNPLTKNTEVLLVVVQMFQLLGYAFDEKFRPLWKNEKLFSIMKVIFIYFKIIPFVRGNTEFYLIFFYLVIIFVLFIVFSLIILAILLPKSKIRCPFMMQILSLIVPIMSTLLFIPIFEILISIFICADGLNQYGENLKCWENEYILHCIIGSITLVIFLLYSFLIQNTYFELKYNKNGYSSKKTLITENIMLYSKIFVIIAIKLIYTSHVAEIIIILITLCMGYLSYSYTYISPYYYYEVQRCYMLMAYITTWTFFVLFLSQLTADTIFNGNMVLLLIGQFIIFIGILLSNKRIDYSLILKCSLHFGSGNEAINQIEEIFSLIDINQNNRISPVLLFGYVQHFSSNSIKENDPLKKYLEENDRNSIIHLITHIHSLYLTALAKFPNHVRLRIFYSIFVFDCLSKREQALRELDIALTYHPKFCHEFIIHRLRNLLENKVCNGNINTFSSEMSELAISLTYKKLYREFKKMINKTANQYISFWNLLSNLNKSNQEDLYQLNKIGSKIKYNLDKIKNLYRKMVKIQPYNQEILLDYSSFTLNVLNDKDKGKILSHQLKELSYSSVTIDEKNLCHLDLNKICSVNDYYYIIFSAMVKNLGIITHISTPVCSLFGYTKEELIGYPIEKLLPELYTKSHQNSLLKIVNSYKKKIFEELNTYHNYKINFQNSDSFGITKSKYLIPFHYKGAFFPNDNGNNYFFMKCIIDTSSSEISYSQSICYVLTDKQLIIQHYSSNATTLLGLNSDTLHSPKEITTCIKQLHEDYITYFINDDNDEQDFSDEVKLEMKCKLLKSKYSAYSPITWLNNTSKTFRKESSCNNYNLREEFKGSILSPTMHNEDNFMLIVSDYGDFGEKEGFIFKFEPIWHFHVKDNNLTTSISNKDLKIRSLKSKKHLYVEDDPSTIMSRLRVGSKESNYSLNQQIKVTKGYVPEISQKVGFDPNKNAFYMTDQNKFNEHHYIIMQQAKEKCNQIKNTKDISSISSSSDNSEKLSSSSVLSNSDDYTLSLQDKIKVTKVEAFTSEYDYYHVNISKIRYSIYNYSKGVVIEKTDFNRISEVENRLFKDTIEEKKQEIDTANGYQNTINRTTPINYNQSQEINFYIKRDQQLIKKEIQKAIKKNYIQISILILYILSITTFALFVIKESLFLYYYLTFMDMIINYITLIRFTYKINRNVLHSIYSVKELLLVNFDSYEIPFYDYTKEEYIKMHLNNLEMLFKDTDDILTIILKNPIQVHPDNKTFMDTEAGYTFFIQASDNYSIGNNSNTFRSACFIVNYGLGDLINTVTNKLYPTNEDVFLFMFTSLNTLWTGLLEQNEVYKNFFRRLIKDLYTKQLLLFFGLETLMVICYVLARVGLKGVSDRNESYFSVYFSIHKDIISTSLAKCEKFIYHFQTNTMQEEINDDISDNGDDFNYKITDVDVVINHPQITVNNKKEITSSLSCPRRFCKKFKCFGQFFIGYMIILIASLAVLFFDGFQLGCLFEVEKHLLLTIKFYEGQASIEKESVLIFNLLRESLFDRNSLFLLTPLKDTLEKLITEVYNKIQKEKKKAEDAVEFLPDLYEYYYSINFENVCDMEHDQDKCINYTSKSGLYGLETLIMYFIEEIRTIYYTDINLKKMNDKFNFTHNYTLYGTKAYESYFPTNPNLKPMYDKVGPMYIFNSIPQQKLSYIYWYLLYPKFQYLIIKIGTSIEQECLDVKQFYIISFSIFIALIFCLVFFIWFPYVHQLNLLIYKTKNMLSIIPIDVLVSVSNINTLLEINNEIDQLYQENFSKDGTIKK